MRSSAATRFRPTASILATLKVDPLYRAAKVGTISLRPSFKETSAWSNTFAGSLGARLRAASPSQVSCEYARVSVAELPLTVQAVLHNDVADGAVKIIDRWLASMARGGGRYSEVVVDRFVGDVLHACDFADGVHTQLRPQEVLRFSLGDFMVASKPDHVLRCGNLLDVVVQESKVDDEWQLGWGQVVGEMVAAALVNADRKPSTKPAPIFAIRVIETRWTFMRADFTSSYLDRLAAYQLQPGDHFNVSVWGGAPVDRKQQTDDAKWGLDYCNIIEREQLVRMIVALGREARALALE